jgi:Polysaccharide pyruvyl transferase
VSGLRELVRGIFDRRCRFYDLRRVPPEKRQARSPLIQFYSSANNIGNFLPVLGMREMLGQEPDCWCIHDRRIDFDFINAHYRGAIIGGAGLLHSSFAPFWATLAAKCRIPMIIWGVGGCFPDSEAKAGIDQKTVAQAAQRCDLINVRDELTVNEYGLSGAHISACPTVVHMRHFLPARTGQGPLLFSSHDELVPPEETKRIHEVLRADAPGYLSTDNSQNRRQGVDDVIRRSYCPAPLIVTTRLHGAIIAYGLELPYVAVARDKKLRDFHRLYGNGVMLERVDELSDVIKNRRAQVTRSVEMGRVLEFGDRAKAWVSAL